MFSINYTAVRSILSLALHPYPSYWRRYFSVGERKQWDTAFVTEWTRLPDCPVMSLQCIGIADTREHFYTGTSVEEEQLQRRTEDEQAVFLKMKADSARTQLDTYLDPQCGCKLGFHWKCRRHGMWKG